MARTELRTASLYILKFGPWIASASSSVSQHRVKVSSANLSLIEAPNRLAVLDPIPVGADVSHWTGPARFRSPARPDHDRPRIPAWRAECTPPTSADGAFAPAWARPGARGFSKSDFRMRNFPGSTFWEGYSRASSHCGRVSSGSTSKPESSDSEIARPPPNSTRPLDSRSSVAMRSATRRGWLMRKGSSTIPCPRRMFLVLAARCDSTSSGEEL